MKKQFPLLTVALTATLAATDFAPAEEAGPFRLYAQTLEAKFASAADAEAATLAFRSLPPGMELSLTARGDDTNDRHLLHARALSAAGAKSTYYINGVSPDHAEKVLRPLLALGHSLGSHTKTHPQLSARNAHWDLIVAEFTATGGEATLAVRGNGTLYLNGEARPFRDGSRIQTCPGLNRVVLVTPMSHWHKRGLLSVFDSGSGSPCPWSPVAP